MPNIISDIKLDFKDVLLCPQESALKSRSEVDLFVELTFRHSKRTYKGLPVMASNMDSVGTFEIAKELAKHGMFTAISKYYYSVEDWIKFAAENPECLNNVCPLSGPGVQDYARLSRIVNSIPEIPYIFVDVANAYSQHFVDFVRKVRSDFPHHTIFAGNVCTGDMTKKLILAGADVVGVGIGPGSVCTTRSKTGVGYPQLSAIIECAEVAHSLNAHILADGGCTCVGDIAKAFGAGADFVMVGQMFAGHDQGGGEIIEKEGKRFRKFYGLCSATAMNKHYGGVADYRAAEGISVEVPSKGDVNATILDILGGLRSACTYVGAGRLQELPERTTFVRCTQQLNPFFNSSAKQ